MNKSEALRILGLEHDASPQEIKIAYRESAQILHPDRFAGNKKLQARATEQFKTLQEAYDILSEHFSASPSDGTENTVSRETSSLSQELHARLSGIQAARTQLVTQRDALFDRRRNALAMAVIGALVAFFLRRIVVIAGIGGTAMIWGIVDLISTISNINSLNERLDALAKEKKSILAKLEELN